MKILQVSNRVPWPLNEGGTIGIYNFTKAFAEAGHEVSLYCLDGLKHNTPVKEAERELSKYAKVFIHPIDTDVKVDEAFKNLLGDKSYNVERFNNEVFKIELEELLSSEKFDVIQMEGTFVGPYVDVIRKHHKGLLSLRMHNVEHQIWQRLAANSKNPLKKQYLKLLAKRLRKYEQHLLSQIDVIIPVTEDDAQVFDALHSGLKQKVIPAGIDTSYWEYKPSEGISEWYHLGSLEWLPNQEAVDWYLSKWHPLLKQNLKDYSFHLAGKGIDAAKYQHIDSCTSYHIVHDAYSFVANKDICVVPLLSGSGIRLKILEAMSAGKLVISTRIGAQGLNVINGEHLLMADNEEELLNIIRDLENNVLDYSQIIKNARKLIDDKYSIEAACAELTDFYRSY